MTLVDIEKLEYEPFIIEDGNNSEVVDYISSENLWKARKVDPVNHAEWVVENRKFYDGDIYIKHLCSHCGEMGAIKKFTSDEWESYYKDKYSPKLSNYCPNCGYKMDLRELYEQYKRDWCSARGYTLEDMDEEVGINGECYACFDEWYVDEYLESRGE